MRMLRQLGREDWVLAGLLALAQGGEAAFGVESVARKLGVTKGSFYWHFRDRAAWRDAVLGYWEHVAFRTSIPAGRARSDGVGWAAVERALRLWARQDVAVAKSVSRVLRERGLHLAATNAAAAGQAA